MRLYMRPGTTMASWQQFVRHAPAHSIALDGFVPEGPQFDALGPHANFNHHEGVSRLETRATCAQVLIALRQGLMHTFDPEQLNVFVNDCDEDVCLSVFLLRNHELSTARINPLLNRLVHMEDMLDTTGGAYTFPDTLESLRELLWVFEPYHVFRTMGALDSQNADEYAAVIDRVGARISMYLAGTGGHVVPDMRYDVIEKTEHFSVLSEVGENGRLGVYEDGINAFIAVRPMREDVWSYTLARSSQFVPFPIPKILKALNAAELDVWRGMVEAMPDGNWGGSEVIAGSPRPGSRLTPRQVTDIALKAIVGH